MENWLQPETHKGLLLQHRHQTTKEVWESSPVYKTISTDRFSSPAQQALESNMGARKNEGAGKTREERGSSLSPLTFLPCAPRFIAPSTQAKFFCSANRSKKDLVRYKVPIFWKYNTVVPFWQVSTLWEFHTHEIQMVSIRERNCPSKPASYLVRTCHILRPVYTRNFFLHFPAQVLVQV